LFVVASVTLLIVPGPAVLYIVGCSLRHGRTAGLLSVLGICTGTLVHLVFAALGLSAALRASGSSAGTRITVRESKVNQPGCGTIALGCGMMPDCDAELAAASAAAASPNEGPPGPRASATPNARAAVVPAALDSRTFVEP